MPTLKRHQRAFCRTTLAVRAMDVTTIEHHFFDGWNGTFDGIWHLDGR
ncbi:hypothetical protein [Ruegeria sp. HKCCD7255]|nr:hypothetical protein [Ruegeria sp. HKCCD7255]